MKKTLHSLLLVLAWVPSLAVAHDEGQPTEAPPREKFDDPSRTFQLVKETLQREYYKGDIAEADLYRAAVQGMLAGVDPSLSRYNRLLSPAEFGEMNIEMTGHLVGIGVQIGFDPKTGVVDVIGTIPGTPAERAGVMAGDKILTIDGTSFKGRNMSDVVGAIRGKEGESVRLDILRDTTVLTKTIRREQVPTGAVSHQRFPGDIEFLVVHAFAKTTPDLLRAALGEIAKSGAKGLVIDLRDNAGGLLDEAVDCAKLLLPRGTVVARLVRRGGQVETLTADQSPLLAPIPTVVLVGEHTMSSAEMLAAALRKGLHAPLIGTKTMGKWSVQRLKELPNHFAIKYTVAAFQTADGESFEGTGLPPDIEVTMEASALDRVMHVQDPAQRLAADVQLRSALNLLRMRP